MGYVRSQEGAGAKDKLGIPLLRLTSDNIIDRSPDQCLGPKAGALAHYGPQ